MKKAKNELKNVADIKGKNLVLRRIERTDPDTGTTTNEIMFSLSGVPVDANGDEITRYDISPQRITVEETTLKNDYPDIYSGLATIWTHMLNKLKTREGL